MGRFSPTVVKDTTMREDPGGQLADAVSMYFQEKRIETDRGEVATDRTRRRAREDITDVVQKGDFEKYLQDRYGATPSYVPGEGLGGGGFDPQQEVAPGPGIGGEDPRGVPSGAPSVFEDARMGIGEPPSALTQPVDLGPAETVVLPGSFAGGQFSPEAITIGGPQERPTRAGRETREFAGESYDLDPSQTLESRTARAEEQERTRLTAEEEAQLQKEISALIEAGVPENQARAVAMFDAEKEFLKPAEEEEAPVGFDPDREGQFKTREQYIAFQKELATAKDAVGRRPPGTGAAARPQITLEKAFEQIDRLFGRWNAESQMYDHHLSEGQQYNLAQRMMSGELTQEEIDAASVIPEDPGEAPPPEFESGAFKRFFQALIPGGKTGFEQVGGEVGPLPEERQADIPSYSKGPLFQDRQDQIPSYSKGPLESSPDSIPREHNEPPQPGGSGSAVQDSIIAIAEQLKSVYPHLSAGQIHRLLVREFPESEVRQVFQGR